MAIESGKCQNRAGCSLAYTGELIRFTGEPRCPECGQVLVPAKKQANQGFPMLFGGGAFFFLILGAGGMILLFGNKPHPKEAIPPPAQASASESTASPAPTLKFAEHGEGKLPPELQNLEAAALRPPPEVVASSAADQSAASSGSTPNPSPAALEVAAGGSPPIAESPAPLDKKQVDTTRDDVLKRINAMPHMSAQEKERLSEKMETAHSMDRLRVIHFELGKTSISRDAAVALAKSFQSKEMQNRLSDPTLIFVVAGYADQGGAPEANLHLSEQRADEISKILKQQGIMNVIHSVAMGSSELLDGKRPDQNRAVEIWAVVP